MGGKETPRQKMIGMMYLVLTALLALNISAEALRAFQIVRDGLEETTRNFDAKNSFTYSAFEAAMRNDPEKTKPFYDKAKIVKAEADQLYNYIEDLKNFLIEEGGGYVGDDKKELKGEKNLEIGSQVMITKGRGAELRKKIVEVRDKFIGLVPEKDYESGMVNVELDAQDPPMSEKGGQKWESYYFEDKPLTAVVTLLSKVQNDVRNAEAAMINYLLTAIGAKDFKFDLLEPAVIAKSSFVFIGQEYQAKVFISASSSTQNPEILAGPMSNGRLLDSTKLEFDSTGKGVYKVKPTREGLIEWGGVIRVKGPDGKYTNYPFQESYIAAQSTVVISPDKMNVLYIGVDNPISISVPGVDNSKITASIDQGSLTKASGGSYVARVSKPGEAVINVTAELSNKEKKSIGSKVFRVKRVPDPVAKFAGESSGTLSRGAIKVQRGIFAVLENFDFDLKFDIIRFKCIVQQARKDPIVKDVTGNAFTPDIIALLERLEPGERVFFDDVFAMGPDKVERKINSIVITAK